MAAPDPMLYSKVLATEDRLVLLRSLDPAERSLASIQKAAPHRFSATRAHQFRVVDFCHALIIGTTPDTHDARFGAASAADLAWSEVSARKSLAAEDPTFR